MRGYCGSAFLCAGVAKCLVHMFAATGLPFDGINHLFYNIANMNLFDYWSKGETRPKPKLVTNNKTEEIGADFFFGGRLLFFEGIGSHPTSPDTCTGFPFTPLQGHAIKQEVVCIERARSY
jgi:hypothetical protein